MAIIRNYDPRVNVTYVYESKGYYDREAHKTKTKRTLIGKLDENGNIVPTGKVGRPRIREKADQDENDSDISDIDYQSLYESYLKDNKLKEKRILDLKAELAQERKTRKECEKALQKIMEIGNTYQSAANEMTT